MKSVIAAVMLSVGLVACGAGGTPNQTCSEQHSCQNGACTCSTGPNQGSSCCDPADSTCTTNKCDTYCKFCQ